MHVLYTFSSYMAVCYKPESCKRNFVVCTRYINRDRVTIHSHFRVKFTNGLLIDVQVKIS